MCLLVALWFISQYDVTITTRSEPSYVAEADEHIEVITSVENINVSPLL